MTLPDGPNQLRGLEGLGELQPGRSTDPAADPTAFRRLLEQLESVAKSDPSTGPGAAEPTDLGALQQALDQADRDYAQVMDLRQRLEEAFRRTAGGGGDGAT